jgi:hypothetical protein
MKKTPDEWLKDPKYSGITVVDPDGWDRINFEQSWAEPITEVEFTARVMMSSCLNQQQRETR